jgi:hypothetical protein
MSGRFCALHPPRKGWVAFDEDLNRISEIWLHHAQLIELSGMGSTKVSAPG